MREIIPPVVTALSLSVRLSGALTATEPPPTASEPLRTSILATADKVQAERIIGPSIVTSADGRCTVMADVTIPQPVKLSLEPAPGGCTTEPT
jgi:hypothetical protein